jgi:hypothetical protein
MTRLPRIMLQLTTALQSTPLDHPDHEGIPALTDSISRIIKGSQVCTILFDETMLMESLGLKVQNRKSNYGMLPKNSCLKEERL